jgi:molybdenum cofactor cytidylyltransferase
MMSSETGIVLLAAGSSARLGKPKQALLYKGKSLLTHAIDVAIESGVAHVVTVLGANADQLMAGAAKPGTTVLINEQWQEGMASSIRVGLNELLRLGPAIRAVIFMVCDQPFVTATLIQQLMSEYHSSGKPIVACSYGESAGTPALFDTTIFAALLKLEGDAGAKKILKSSPGQVSTIPFPEGNIDIDTAADYDHLVLMRGEDNTGDIKK